MVDSWGKRLFGDCAVLIKDTVHPDNALGMPYIGLEHITEGTLSLNGWGKSSDVTSNKSRFLKGDILFGKLRPYFRKVIIAPFDGVCSTDIWVVRAKTGIEQRFLYYIMASLDFVEQATRASEGTKMPRAKWDYLEKLEYPIPPLPEQKAIAHVLGTLDDKIELNRRMNETLEAMARAIFKSWFVDFDPVRAKSEGQDTGLPDEISSLFPSKFVDSELGEIPKGWEIKTIEDLAERIGMGPFGSSIKVETFVPDGIPIISGQHLNQTLLNDDHYNFITYEHADKLKNANVYRGDVIFTHAGNIGQVAYIPETSLYERYIISQRQFFMRCNLSKISPLYIVNFFKTPEGQHSLLANRSSTGVPSISRPVSYLKTIILSVPPRSLLITFEKLIQSMHLKLGKNTIQSKTLTLIRESLLPKLISGEVQIKNI